MTKTFTWDLAAGLPQVLDDASAKYVYGAGLLEQKSASGTYYYLADGLGSVMKTTDASGNVVNAYSYDVYGKTASATGPQTNDKQFAGEQTHPTGLQYLRARYYDPATGSFLSRDPMSTNATWTGSPYAYAAASPVNASDPTGQNVHIDTDYETPPTLDTATLYTINVSGLASDSPPPPTNTPSNSNVTAAGCWGYCDLLGMAKTAVANAGHAMMDCWKSSDCTRDVAEIGAAFQADGALLMISGAGTGDPFLIFIGAVEMNIGQIAIDFADSGSCFASHSRAGCAWFMYDLATAFEPWSAAGRDLGFLHEPLYEFGLSMWNIAVGEASQ